MGAEPRKIGRVTDYHTGWSWLQMDDAGDIERGSTIRVTPYGNGESLRSGEAKVAMRMGHALHFDEPLYASIPAMADLDYVYLVEDA